MPFFDVLSASCRRSLTGFNPRLFELFDHFFSEHLKTRTIADFVGVRDAPPFAFRVIFYFFRGDIDMWP